MSILQSKLAQNHKTIAEDLEILLKEGRNLGAMEGSQRLELISEQYTQLSPNTAYLWIDPNAVQREIEDAQLHTKRMELMHFLRNVLSLAPLIATWAALFTAVNAYQRDLAMRPDDITKPFLELWQSGFNGLIWLTFTFAAGLDVVLLSLYLLSILIVHNMERRSYARSVDFVRRLQGKIDELLKCVANEGIFHVGDQADIDKVADAVKKVVDSATDSIKQTVSSASDAFKLFVDQTVDTNKQAMADFEQSYKTYIADSQTAIKLVADSSIVAINASNSKVETLFNQQVMPLMTSFHQDMGTLHTELGNYQGRLNDLTNASQQLASASTGLVQVSQTLTANADRYITIGQDIGAQIASLNTTQRDVLSQIETVASGISTAAGNMTTATTNMIVATKTVEGVSRQLDSGMRNTISLMTHNVDQATQALTTMTNTMTHNVDQATQALAHVAPHLYQTAVQLNNASSLLASIQRNSSRFPWFFRRRSSKKGGPTA